MNYNFSEISYPSKDGKNTVYACIYTPKYRTARGIVQLVHGMIDYVERYEELADFLTGEGYIFAGNHHLGHGRTAASEADFGFFAEEDAVATVLSDIHSMNRHLRHTFPTLPLIIFGHSMGSFLTRLYVEKYPHSIKGAVIHGTSGPLKVIGMGKLVAGALIKMNGPRYRSMTLARLAFSGYNSHFDKSEGIKAWLTRDAEVRRKHDEDPFSNFIFTVSGYRDLFTMLGDCNKKGWFSAYPTELPTLIMSGDADPVGKYGKGPTYVYKQLLMSGCKNVALKMYEGARHELFLETNREEMFADLLSWLNEIT